MITKFTERYIKDPDNLEDELICIAEVHEELLEVLDIANEILEKKNTKAKWVYYYCDECNGYSDTMYPIRLEIIKIN